MRNEMRMICSVRKFEDLPENAQNYVKYVEKVLGVPVHFVGVGAGRDAVISHYTCFFQSTEESTL